MKDLTNQTPELKKKNDKRHSKRTKKSQILSLYSDGVLDLNEIAQLTETKISYVASVLQNAGLISGYFDLYTDSHRPMNAYSRYFSGRLGFKNEDVARKSVDLLENFYNEFAGEKDRAGQHHALSLALMIFDRARWSKKGKEAEYFRKWLVRKLEDARIREDGYSTDDDFLQH